MRLSPSGYHILILRLKGISKREFIDWLEQQPINLSAESYGWKNKRYVIVSSYGGLNEKGEHQVYHESIKVRVMPNPNNSTQVEITCKPAGDAAKVFLRFIAAMSPETQERIEDFIGDESISLTENAPKVAEESPEAKERENDHIENRPSTEFLFNTNRDKVLTRFTGENRSRTLDLNYGNYTIQAMLIATATSTGGYGITIFVKFKNLDVAISANSSTLRVAWIELVQSRMDECRAILHFPPENYHVRPDLQANRDWAYSIGQDIAAHLWRQTVDEWLKQREANEAAQTSQSATGVPLDYKEGNMRRLTVGSDVGSFKIYREFWKAVEEVEQFTENKSQWILGELILDLRREAVGLWLLTVQNSPESLRGQVELTPGQSPNETNINIHSAEQFGTIGHLMTFFAKELKQFAENRGLLYPPRSGAAQTTQPTKESMVRDDMQSEAGDLFLWEYLNRNKLSMILEKTPLADFTNWLEQQASFPYGKSLRTENGHISLQSARRAHRTNNDLVWEIGAIYFHSDKDDSSNTLKSDPPLSAISFELIKLGENLKVIAACHQLAVKRYFDQLLAAIAQDFPSAQVSVMEYLKETKEESPTALDGQNDQATSRNYEFENGVFIPLWNGLSVEESMPIELIDRRLRERTYEKGKVKIKVERVEYDGAIGRYHLSTSTSKAEITLITQGTGASITFVRPTDCELSDPNGDAYKEFVSAVIWWARHDYRKTQETQSAESGANTAFIQTAGKCKSPDRLLATVQAMLTRHLPADDTTPLHSGRIDSPGKVLGNKHERHILTAVWRGFSPSPIGHIEYYPAGDKLYRFELARYLSPPEIEDDSSAADFFGGLVAQLDSDYSTKDMQRVASSAADEPLPKPSAATPKRITKLPRGKRGRKPTPIEKRLEYVLGWLAVQDDMTQAQYCSGKGISPSSLREWIGEYERDELKAN